ncbi:MAG TPA: glycosyltransferase family 39 protein [Candidatus Cybelea sp.]|nr:glycosyltransferase family 39 protein [Candidatus Cybelea sp.]
MALRWPPFAAVAVGFNLLVTLPLAWVLNIWQDEAYTLHTTGSGVAYAFHQALAFEQNAPLYFVLISIWRSFGDNIFFLRLFSVLCIAATVLIAPAIARRYLPKQNAGLVTAVVACNPFLIWAAVEIRVYAMIVFVSALLLLTFYDAFVAQRRSLWAVAGYAACVALALYTQYYLAFLVAGQALTVVVFYRRMLLQYVLAGIAATLAFLPMLAIVPGQVSNFKDGFAAPSLPYTIATLGGILARYVLPLPVPHSLVVYAGLGVCAVIALAIVRPKIVPTGNAAILLTTAAAFVLFAAATYVSGVHILDRHAASLFLPATLSVFALFSFLPPPRERRAATIWTVIAVTLSLLTLAKTYHHLAKPGDWRRVAAYVGANEKPNEPIVVFEAENALPLEYYYRGPNRIVAVPHAVDFHRYVVTRFRIENEAELRDAVPAQKRLWLVTAGSCRSANVRFGCATLERYVQSRYRVESDAEFDGARVRLLEKSPAK